MTEKMFISVVSRNTASWGMYSHLQIACGHMHRETGIVPVLKPHVGDSLVSRARNNAMGDFLDSDCDYYFSLDDDIALPYDAFTKLLYEDKDIVGGFYRLKKDVDNKIEFNISDYLAFRGKAEFNMNSDSSVEVVYISTGCILHRRKFIEEMRDHYPELSYQENGTERRLTAVYQPYIYKDEYLSEDWAFCQRAIDKGYKMWMHPGVMCDHWGIKSYTFKELLEG